MKQVKTKLIYHIISYHILINLVFTSFKIILLRKRKKKQTHTIKKYKDAHEKIRKKKKVDNKKSALTSQKVVRQHHVLGWY